MIDLNEFITPECIVHPLNAGDAQSAIKELVQHLCHCDLIEDPDAIAEIVWTREQQRSTGIGDGIAVPHGRCDRIKRIVAAIGFAPTPIDFKAGDGKPVNLVVLLVSPTENTSIHVQALGAISRQLSDEETRQAVRRSSNAESLYELLCSASAS